MSNLARLFLAQERIQYNVNSKLRIRLTDLFQECLDAVAENNASGAVTAIGYAARIATLLKKKVKIQERFAKIIEDELGMIVKEFDLLTGTSPNAYMGPIPVAKGFNPFRSEWDVDEFLKQRESAKGTIGHVPEEEYRRRTISLFRSIGEGVDEDTGKYNQTTAESIEIYTGLEMCFFDISRFHPGVQNFTAGEIAAIVLHELGHGVTLVESMKDFYYKSTSIMDTVRYLSRNATPDNIDVVLNEADKFAENNKASIGAVAYGRYRKFSQGFKGKDKSNRFSEVGTIFIQIVALVLMASLANIVGRFLGDGVSSAASNVGSNDSKRGDVAFTSRNHSYFERVADEFAGRHGASGDLSLALAKMYQCGGTPIFIQRNPSVIMNGLYGLFSLISGVFGLLLPPMAVIAFPYEEASMRFARMKQDAMAFFKDPDAPKEMRDRMIEQVKMAEQGIARFNEPSMRKLKDFIWGTLLRMNSQSTVIGGIVNGNMAADYYNVLHLVDHLIREPLYYQAGRIGSLRDRSK